MFPSIGWLEKFLSSPGSHRAVWCVVQLGLTQGSVARRVGRAHVRRAGRAHRLDSHRAVWFVVQVGLTQGSVVRETGGAASKGRSSGKDGKQASTLAAGKVIGETVLSGACKTSPKKDQCKLSD